MNSKLLYLANSLQKRLLNHPYNCPGCYSNQANVIDSKIWGITTLVECDQCGLLYRTPTDSPKDSIKFYQESYSQGFTTDCPSEEQLITWKQQNFANSPKDFSHYLEVLKAFGCLPGSKIFDFGCSWGYGSYQLKQAGYNVEAFEISAPRCVYAVNKLDIKATNNLSELSGDFDIFFSAHVLEHVSDLYETINLAKKITKPGGLFIAFTPNGSLEYRQSNWQGFHKSWGLVHPNVLQDKYYKYIFQNHAYLIASCPYNWQQISSWNRQDRLVLNLSGWELLLGVIL